MTGAPLTERSPDKRREVNGSTALINQFTEDHPGHPLGPGYPTGSPLRMEVFREETQMWRGESHLMAWERIIRFDPCSYCGRSYSGTVDHIEPKSKPVRLWGTAYTWANLTGACESCNGSKADLPLIRFLTQRAGYNRRGRT